MFDYFERTLRFRFDLFFGEHSWLPLKDDAVFGRVSRSVTERQNTRASQVSQFCLALPPAQITLELFNFHCSGCDVKS